MGPDRAKQFMRKNGDRIPAGETVRAGIIAEAKGGAWRRGMAAAGPLTSALASDAREQDRATQRQEAGGAAADWPTGSLFWLILTDQQLHVFEGLPNSQNLGPGAASYPLERISDMRYDKKLLISKLTVTFDDGSAIELDVSKQKVQPFTDAISARA